MYGARIKTWQGGSGYARNIHFQHIHLREAKNPIIIDQFYCNGRHDCKNSDLHLVSFLFLFIATSSFGIGYGENGTYNVFDFGASGDGVVDDSQAWQRACGTPGSSQALSIPQGKTYLLNPLRFLGPCKSNNVQIQVDGNIVVLPILMYGQRRANLDAGYASKTVGSLGQGEADDRVEQVHVQHCTFTNTQNSARIKTWKAIKMSDVTYTGFHGTSASEQAITLDCDIVGCTNIVMDHVNLTSAVP
ncbi:hypothetical protein C1H46_026022 [Malus baccata]|uniref:Pectate lyase superfamily protein domain-containing protein n=1 Tax=Malus baccata TaxID=106549 RepID=A0A540LPL2_MALBA|nr:hypothetical protein C1H46_026022 [Malus baccata]